MTEWFVELGFLRARRIIENISPLDIGCLVQRLSVYFRIENERLYNSSKIIERKFLSADVGREQSRSRNGSIDEMDIINNVSLQRKEFASDNRIDPEYQRVRKLEFYLFIIQENYFEAKL